MIWEPAATISVGLGKRLRSIRPATSVSTNQASSNRMTVASPIKVLDFTLPLSRGFNQRQLCRPRMPHAPACPAVHDLWLARRNALSVQFNISILSENLGPTPHL